MRDCTERPEGIDAGVVRLVGTNPNDIISGVATLLDDQTIYQAMSSAINPYGDGTASQQIANILGEH
jgi:UDP-N-acetylglucosamine 2-epimerase (non-hydrolysing)